MIGGSISETLLDISKVAIYGVGRLSRLAG
jgi:hypothetical protein